MQAYCRLCLICIRFRLCFHLLRDVVILCLYLCPENQYSFIRQILWLLRLGTLRSSSSLSKFLCENVLTEKVNQDHLTFQVYSSLVFVNAIFLLLLVYQMNEVECVMRRKILYYYPIQLLLILLNYFYHSILFIYHYKSISCQFHVKWLCTQHIYLDCSNTRFFKIIKSSFAGHLWRRAT